MRIDSTTAQRQAFSISEFCARNAISLHLYHKLRQQGRAPKTMALGRAIRISIEAEQAWRAEREMPSDTEARLIKREFEARARQAKKAAKLATASPRHVSKRASAGA